MTIVYLSKVFPYFHFGRSFTVRGRYTVHVYLSNPSTPIHDLAFLLVKKTVRNLQRTKGKCGRKTNQPRCLLLDYAGRGVRRHAEQKQHGRRKGDAMGDEMGGLHGARRGRSGAGAGPEIGWRGRRGGSAAAPG